MNIITINKQNWTLLVENLSFLFCSFTDIGEAHRDRRLFGTNMLICSCLRVTWLFKQLSLLEHRWAVAGFDLAALFVLAGWNHDSLGHKCSWELKGEHTHRHHHTTVKYILPLREERIRRSRDHWAITAGPHIPTVRWKKCVNLHVWLVRIFHR